MPRKRTPWTPKYRCHKASGNAVVTPCGQDFYLSKNGTPESGEEYDRRGAVPSRRLSAHSTSEPL